MTYAVAVTLSVLSLATSFAPIALAQIKPPMAQNHIAASAGGANGHVWHMKRVEAKTTIGWNAQPNWNIQAMPQKQVVAMSMMVPTDWQFNGGPKNPQPNDCNFTSGRLGFVATSPDKKSGIVSLPSPVSIWTSDPMVRQSIQQDNQQYGRMQVCKMEQPQPLAQKIAERVREFGKGIEPIGQMEPVPGIADKLNASIQQANQQLAQQGSHVTAEVGRIRTRSADNSDDSDGYFTTMQVIRTDRLQNGATITTIDYPMQVGTFTPKGQYASMDAMFAAMLDSININPEYQQSCLHASANMQSIKLQMKQRISHIQAQMAADNLNASRQQAAIRQSVSDYSRQVHASVAANRSAALEHSSQQFSMYMGDQALYHDPSTGHTVQLPSGSNHAWASTTGNSNEYILTDSPSFDPNGHVGSGSWTQMQEVR